MEHLIRLTIRAECFGDVLDGVADDGEACSSEIPREKTDGQVDLRVGQDLLVSEARWASLDRFQLTWPWRRLMSVTDDVACKAGYAANSRAESLAV